MADATAPTVFGQLLADIGVSDTRFAHLVNDRARAQRRIQLGLARTTVGHWRRGMRPRDAMVAELAAAEVSALVGFPVSPADLGWRGKPLDRDEIGLTVAEKPADTIRTVAGISGRDMRRRDLLHDGTTFIATAFAAPVLASLTGVIGIAGSGDGPAATGTMVSDMTATFRRLDARFGSAEIRLQVVALLHDQVEALDRCPGPDVFRALGELTQFAAWLAHDSGQEAAAQRYWIQALALAEHGDDAAQAAWVLSGMSDQAGRLGHRRDGLALARASVDRAGRDAPPGVEAMLYSRVALAAARCRDEPGATKALHAMDAAMGRADGDGPAWAAHFNEADVAECRGHCLRLLGRPGAAAKGYLEARRTQDAERARARACTEAGLALALLEGPGRDLDAALDAGRRALSLGGQLGSARVGTDLARLDAALPADRPTVAVREWRAAYMRRQC